MNTCWAVIPAAGTGLRFGHKKPKQYQLLAGSTVIEHSINCLLRYSPTIEVTVAIAENDSFFDSLPVAKDPRVASVVGGTTRSASVLRAIAAFRSRSADNDWVLVHDAVRPCLQQQCLDRLFLELRDDPVGGFLAWPVADSLHRVDRERLLSGTTDRDFLYAAQTPQLFRCAHLYNALQWCHETGVNITDEASALFAHGHRVRTVTGHPGNIKITSREDLSVARSLLTCAAEYPDTDSLLQQSG